VFGSQRYKATNTAAKTGDDPTSMRQCPMLFCLGSDLREEQILCDLTLKKHIGTKIYGIFIYLF
jgi:hypothetical protein